MPDPLTRKLRETKRFLFDMDQSEWRLQGSDTILSNWVHARKG